MPFFLKISSCGLALAAARLWYYASNWPVLPRTGIARKWMSMIATMRPHPLPQRGDVVLVLYPNSDLRTAKKRPASNSIQFLLLRSTPTYGNFCPAVILLTRR